MGNQDRVKALLERLNIEYPPCGFYVGDGWLPIVAVALEKMIAAGWDRKLAQVKQKFCTLRIYVDEYNEQTASFIREAEVACAVACENCGQPHNLSVPRSGLAYCIACKEKDEST